MHFYFQISHSYWKQEGGLSPLMLSNPVTCLLENLTYKPEKKYCSLLSALESRSPEYVIWVKSCNLHSHE